MCARRPPPGSAGLVVSAGVFGLNPGGGSVSAQALAPGACGGDIEEGMGLPQLGPPLQVIHVAGGGLCIRACGEAGNQIDEASIKKQRSLKRNVTLH